MLKKLLKLSLLLSLVHQTSQAYEIRINKTLKQLDSEFKRDATKEVVLDTKRNKMWQDNKAVTATTKNWQDAKQHCKDLYLAGYSDWYLPSIKELETLAKNENYPRAIIKVFRYTMPSPFWSSSAHVSYTNYAWDVDFEYGYSLNDYESRNYYVRCVRAGQ